MGNGRFTLTIRSNREAVCKPHPAIKRVRLVVGDFTAGCIQLRKGILAGLPPAVVRAPA